MRQLDGITDSMDMNLSKLHEKEDSVKPNALLKAKKIFVDGIKEDTEEYEQLL